MGAKERTNGLRRYNKTRKLFGEHSLIFSNKAAYTISEVFSLKKSLQDVGTNSLNTCSEVLYS